MQGWTIGGTAGQTVTVDLESDEFDPYLFVAGPGIAEPMQDDDSGGNCNARVTLTFPRAGEYLVVVNSSNPRATASPASWRAARTPVRSSGRAGPACPPRCSPIRPTPASCSPPWETRDWRCSRDTSSGSPRPWSPASVGG